jgi:hypothetical protein
MANTYELIEAKTLGSAAVSVEFTSIPATYTDLILLTSTRGTRAGNTNDDFTIQFNGITTGYSSTAVEGYGSSAASYSTTSIIINSVGPNSTASTFSNGSIYIPNYTSANYKSVSVDSVAENNATAATASLSAGLWSNTAAITSIKLQSRYTSDFVQYSSFYLYGIKNS